MADFSIISNYNPNANFKLVQIGSDAPVLETELNELQEIADNKMNMFLQGFVGDGLSTIKNINYDSETRILTIRDNIAFVQGRLIPITTLKLEVNNNEVAYLKVWEETVTYSDPVKLYGNEQEQTLVQNYLLDQRIAMETSRRVQVKYDLVKSNEQSEGVFYLPICSIKDGLMTMLAKVTHDYDSIDAGDFSTHSDYTIDCGYF